MKLSVLMITYNHEKFIAQALDSVLMQEVNFDYEIVIGEDCSTDTTREIVIGYQKKHPDKIRLLLPEKNLGMIKNFVATFKSCKGEYIALLEGDDYWTAPDKLQRQVDFLDNNPECSACFHNVTVIDDVSKETRPFHEAGLKEIHTIEDIVSSFFIPTCSVVCRNGLINEFPDWYYEMPIGDWPLHVLNAEHGNFGYMHEIMASYRVHESGMWSMRNRVDMLLKTMSAVNIINRHLEYKYDKKIKANISGWHYEIVNILSGEGDVKGAYCHALKTSSVYLFLKSLLIILYSLFKRAFGK